MAIKDWVKTRAGWFNEKRDEQIEVNVIFITDLTKKLRPSKKRYSVGKREFSISPEIFSLKTFTNKVKAMKFTKAYMRKH